MYNDTIDDNLENAINKSLFCSINHWYRDTKQSKTSCLWW